jgi:hypothetical protein
MDGKEWNGFSGMEWYGDSGMGMGSRGLLVLQFIGGKEVG